jgi:hypothetical protein
MVLCFHRHSRIVRSFLKNSFVLAFIKKTIWPWSSEPICGILAPIGAFSGVRWHPQGFRRVKKLRFDPAS